MSLLLFVLLALLPARAALRVVASVPTLAAIAQEVGGAEVKVTPLSTASQDPHWVDARPNLALALSKADLLIVVGLDLEVGWLPALQTGSRNPAVQLGARGYLDSSRFVNLLEIPAGRVDRSEGDIHPGGNPHYLHDPRSYGPVAYGIAQRMGELDPPNAAAYMARAQAFAVAIGERIPAWEARLACLRGARLVGYHKSWPYLADWLGLEMVEHVEPKPGIPPNPAHVARVIEAMQRHGVPAIIEMAYTTDATVDQISRQTGAKVIRLPAGVHVEKGETVVQHMDEIVQLLAGLCGG